MEWSNAKPATKRAKRRGRFSPATRKRRGPTAMAALTSIGEGTFRRATGVLPDTELSSVTASAGPTSLKSVTAVPTDMTQTV